MLFPPEATLGDIGEFGLIAELTEVFTEGRDMLVGPGDDAAVLRVRQGHVVVSTDLLIEGQHFRNDWVEATDVGHRAAAQNLSDINAMGGRAHSLTIGLEARHPTCRRGGRSTSRPGSPPSATSSAPSAPGDLTRCDQVVIAVTVIGACAQAPVLRSGAEPGDVLALTGRQGGPPAALPSSLAGSARRGCWSRPTAAPARRTTPGGPPPRQGPRR